MLRLIYLAHPFGGNQENVEKAEKIIKGLLHKHLDCTFYSPLHATGFMYSQLTYLDGMEHCFEALSRCDELWLCGDWRESVGCNMEYGFAKAKGIPIKFVGGLKMAKCKYPDEVCVNMTVYHGEVYCDSTPCSLHDEFLPETNGDKIRKMSNEELAREMLFFIPSDFSGRYTGITGGYYATAQDAIEANFEFLQRSADT